MPRLCILAFILLLTTGTQAQKLNVDDYSSCIAQGSFPNCVSYTAARALELFGRDIGISASSAKLLYLQAQAEANRENPDRKLEFAPPGSEKKCLAGNYLSEVLNVARSLGVPVLDSADDPGDFATPCLAILAGPPSKIRFFTFAKIRQPDEFEEITDKPGTYLPTYHRGKLIRPDRRKVLFPIQGCVCGVEGNLLVVGHESFCGPDPFPGSRQVEHQVMAVAYDKTKKRVLVSDPWYPEPYFIAQDDLKKIFDPDWMSTYVLEGIQEITDPDMKARSLEAYAKTCRDNSNRWIFAGKQEESTATYGVSSCEPEARAEHRGRQ
jgi:hypothetical protein